MRDLSVLIPARNEEWLARTVDDVLAHKQADTEIIVVLDGAWPPVPLAQHPDVQVLYVPDPIGQRAAVNIAARVSRARYLMKLDAHCAVGPGFDRILIDAADRLGPTVTQIPAQKNLHIYDRVCRSCGARNYQGPKDATCNQCGGDCDVEVVWAPRPNTTTTCWYFDSEPRFQYAPSQMKQRQVWEDGIADVMTSLGACFFMRRDFFGAIGGIDEEHGSWGSFGIEIACKTWLSGGRHVVNKNTWFAHFFRVGGIGFPYPIKGSEQEAARERARELWFKATWDKAIHPLSWLVEKFAPVPGWDDKSVRRLTPTTPTAGLVYYSDCRPEPWLLEACRAQLRTAAPDLPLVSVTLQPVPGFGQNIVVDKQRGYLTMFEQILAGLEALDTDVAFLVEHDVLYHPSHFAFRPSDDRTYYYNQRVWKVDAESGRALHYLCNQTSGLCANRELLVNHYRARVAWVRAHGFSRRNGFEPGTRSTRNGGFDDYGHSVWMSEHPNIDVRHAHNLTASRWSKDQFKNQKYCQGWTEAESIPGWGQTAGRFRAFLDEHVGALLTR